MFMNKKFIYFLTVCVLLSLLSFMFHIDEPTINSQLNQKNERADIENTHKVITNKDELEEIAEKENLKRIPIRVEHEYNGPKE